jgi:hypothetical protein
MHALDEPLSPECWSPGNVGAQGLYWYQYVQRKLKLSVSIAAEVGPMHTFSPLEVEKARIFLHQDTRAISVFAGLGWQSLRSCNAWMQ